MMNYHDMTTLAQWKGPEAAERLWRAGRETPIVMERPRGSTPTGTRGVAPFSQTWGNVPRPMTGQV